MKDLKIVSQTGRAKRTLIIHLGFPKTGTTTIQRMLTQNAEALAPDLVVSAKDDLTYRLRKYALRYRRTGFPYWKWRHNLTLRAVVRRIDALAFNTLVISDENMIGIESGKLFLPSGELDYADWLAKLDNALSHYDVTYVVYTRATESWQVSSYNQAFKMRRVTEPFCQWRLDHNNLDGPDQIISSLRSVVGDRLKTFRMEDDTREGRVMS